MTRKLKNNTGIIALFVLLALASCRSQSHSEQGEVYTCPMHPTVTSEQPGKCPVCGMDLVRSARPGEELAMTPELSSVLKSPDEVVVGSVRTVRAEYKSMPVDIAAEGIVTYDTRRVHTIPARIAGRLERVYITYELQPVAAGQRIAEIYSPELNTAQRELIFLLESDDSNTSLIDASRRKLELLGMTASQIDALTQSRAVTSTITIYSPFTGYVTSGGPPPSLSMSKPLSDTSDGEIAKDMNDMSATTSKGQTGSTSRGVLVRAGDYVSAGQRLFTLVDPKAIRIELNVPGTSDYDVREGSTAQLLVRDQQPQNVTIDFAEPFVRDGQPFTRVRVYAETKGNLRIGSLVSARIRYDVAESLWVPRESVLDLGTQQVVFVQQRGVLKPKSVRTGMTSEGMVEIKSGLATSDEIAANAQYLVDSESFVKPIN